MFKKATKAVVKDAANAVKEEFKEEINTINTIKIVAAVSIVVNVLLMLQNHRMKSMIPPSSQSPVTIIFPPYMPVAK